MAVLSATHPTLLDLVKRQDPKGGIDTIIEMLAQTNEVLTDCVWLPSNQDLSHRTTVRTGLPAPTWRKIYGGVQPTKSTTAQVTDTLGDMQAYAEVDKLLADINGNTAAFRLSEEAPHIEGMNQEFADTFFAGNETTEPEAFTGLLPRFNSLSAANAENILKGPAGTAYTSIWLVGWGPNTAHCIYPKGMQAGLQHKDLGEVTIENIDGAGGRMQAYRSHYKWTCGFSLRNWQYVVRIQVATGELTKAASAGADLIDLMSQAVELPPELSTARFAWYGNRTIKSFLKRQIANKVASSTLSMDTVAGKRVLTFDDIPFRRCDKLHNAETVVS